MEENSKNLNNLKEVLDREGRTQAWLVKKVNEKGVKLDRSKISLICSEKANTSIPTWIKIADLLECSLDDLLRKDMS